MNRHALASQLAGALVLLVGCDFATGARCRTDLQCPTDAPYCGDFDENEIGFCAVEPFDDAGVPPDDGGPPPADGGAEDAGPMDAGPMDAGGMDDAGPVDAGGDDDAGDGDGGGEPDPCDPDVVITDAGFPPFGNIHFPRHAMTTFEHSILVRYRAGDDIAICSTTVNGLQGTRDPDNGNYYQRVPLDLGPNELQLTVEAAGESIQVIGPTVHRVGYMPAALDGAVRVTGPDGVLMTASVDNFDNVVFGFDDTGVFHYLSGALRGQGTVNVDAPNSIAAMPGASTVYVSNSAQIIEIDLNTGDRTEIASQGVGSGLWPGNVLRKLAVDNDSTLYAFFDGGVILAIDLATIPNATRTLVSDDTNNGSLATDVQGFTFMDGSLYMSTALASPTILQVDLTTGDRTTVSDDSTGTGTFFDSTGALGVRGANLLMGTNDGALYSVSVSTGDRTVIASDSLGTGATWSRPSGVAATDTTAWVVDRESFQAFEVELATGNRTRHAVDVGAGPKLSLPRGISLAPGSGALVVVDESSRVFQVEFETGDRSVLSSDSIHSTDGFSYGDLQDLAATSENTIVITDDSNKVVWEYDNEFGTRKPYSAGTNSGGLDAANNTGNGPDMVALKGIGVHDTGEVWVGDPTSGVVYQIAPLTHDRTSLTLPAVAPFTPGGLEGDFSGDVMFIADSANSRVLRANNAGSAIALSGGGVGMGEDFFGTLTDVASQSGPEVYVLTSTFGDVYSVSLDTGERSNLSRSSPHDGQGPNFAASPGFAVDGYHAYILDWQRDAIGVLDLDTGERAFFSH